MIVQFDGGGMSDAHAWVEYVRAAVGCPECGGTGGTDHPHRHPTGEIEYEREYCPAEHVQLSILGETIWADPSKCEWQCNHTVQWATGSILEEIPWCAEHNAEYSERLGKCWVYRGSPTACRVEKPARHLVIREAE